MGQLAPKKCLTARWCESLQPWLESTFSTLPQISLTKSCQVFLKKVPTTLVLLSPLLETPYQTSHHHPTKCNNSSSCCPCRSNVMMASCFSSCGTFARTDRAKFKAYESNTNWGMAILPIPSPTKLILLQQMVAYCRVTHLSNWSDLTLAVIYLFYIATVSCRPVSSSCTSPCPKQEICNHVILASYEPSVTSTAKNEYEWAAAAGGLLFWRKAQISRNILHAPTSQTINHPYKTTICSNSCACILQNKWKRLRSCHFGRIPHD